MIKICEICGGRLNSTLAVHKTPDRFELHVGISEENYRRRWDLCVSCGSASNIMDPANAARLAKLSDGYYEVDFINSSVAEKYTKVISLPEDKSDNAGRVKRVSERMDAWREILGISKSIATVLDVGAGTGVFLSRLLQTEMRTITGWEATAIEPDSVAAAHLVNLSKFKVVQKAFDGSLVDRDYDLITMNKIIEHVPKPGQILSKAAQNLACKGGMLYVEVPDVLTIGRRPLSDNILGSLHYHLYSPRGLITLIEDAGLTMLNLGRVVEPSGKITLFGFACTDAALNVYAAEKTI